MIQRIQTLWLLLSAICCGILLFKPEIYSGIATDGSLRIFSVTESEALMFLLGVNPALSVLNIFRFKNRSLQKRGVLINTVGVILFVGLLKYFTLSFAKEFGIQQGHWNYFAILPFFSLLFLVLAFIGIKKDEKLLSESDRLR